MQIEKYQNQIFNLVKKAGKILLREQDKIEIVAFKDRQDIATNLDLRIEKLIVSFIKKNFPDHNIDSEEKGFIKGNSDYTWIIDPIDGSKHYIRKISAFYLSIALKYKKNIIFGLVYNPSTGELFYAYRGKGAYRNGKKIRVSDKRNLKDSFVYAELPSFDMKTEDFKKSSKILEKLNKNSYRVRSFGCASIGLSYVASGAFEAYITLGKPNKLCDYAGGVIIVEEAGGKITDLKGEKLEIDKGKLILASNKKVHNSILKLIK